jgi:hypothetical protein
MAVYPEELPLKRSDNFTYRSFRWGGLRGGSAIRPTPLLTTTRFSTY